MISANSVRMILTASAKTLNVPLPDKLTASITEAVALQGKARALTSERTRAALTDAVVAELNAGKDPCDSSAVARAALADQIGQAGIGGAVAGMTDRLITTALVDATDDILSSWATALVPHADNLVSAANQLGTDNLHELSSIQRAPGRLLASCRRAQPLRRRHHRCQAARCVVPSHGVGLHPVLPGRHHAAGEPAPGSRPARREQTVPVAGIPPRPDAQPRRQHRRTDGARPAAPSAPASADRTGYGVKAQTIPCSHRHARDGARTRRSGLGVPRTRPPVTRLNFRLRVLGWVTGTAPKHVPFGGALLIPVGEAPGTPVVCAPDDIAAASPCIATRTSPGREL